MVAGLRHHMGIPYARGRNAYFFLSTPTRLHRLDNMGFFLLYPKKTHNSIPSFHFIFSASSRKSNFGLPPMLMPTNKSLRVTKCISVVRQLDRIN
jgi:hypothetical protein